MNILKRLFGLEKIAEEIEAGGGFEGLSGDGQGRALELERIAIRTAVGYIASAVSQCTFRTFVDGEEKRMGPEYILWNYSPNRNQNSTEFLRELVESMIYDSEALVVECGGMLYVADAYGAEQDGIREWRYTGIVVNGQEVPDRPESQVLRFRFDDYNVRSLLESVCGQYEELIESAIQGYQKTYADKGVLEIDAVERSKKDYGQILDDLVNKRFKKFFSSQSAVLPLHKGYSYTPQTKALRNTSEINDVKELSDEIYNRVGQALRFPPVLLKGDVAGMEEAGDLFLKFGVKPICNLLEEEITRKRYTERELRRGCYVSVDMSGIDMVNVFRSAEKIDKLISCGLYSIDEVRDKVGEPLLNTEEAQRHYITKNYTEMGENGGGSGNGEDE